jgi:hypothetical protein
MKCGKKKIQKYVNECACHDGYREIGKNGSDVSCTDIGEI